MFDINGNYIVLSDAEKAARKHRNCSCRDCRSLEQKKLCIDDETMVAIEDVMNNGTYGDSFE